MKHSKFNGLLLDLDGTIYEGRKLIDGAQAFIAWLRSNGINYRFITNNSTRTVEGVINLLSTMGLEETPENIITSAIATVNYLEKRYPISKKVFVVGEEGLLSSISCAGYTITDKDPDVVVVGLDRTFTYSKIETAVLAIRGKADFILTNPDKVLPTEVGLLPGAGSIAAMIISETGKNPVIIGKPSKHIFMTAIESMGIDKSSIIMVGDNIETDIKGALLLNIKTALVMTGVTDQASLEKSPIKPDFVVERLMELTQVL